MCSNMWATPRMPTRSSFEPDVIEDLHGRDRRLVVGEEQHARGRWPASSSSRPASATAAPPPSRARPWRASWPARGVRPQRRPSAPAPRPTPAATAIDGDGSRRAGLCHRTTRRGNQGYCSFGRNVGWVSVDACSRWRIHCSRCSTRAPGPPPRAPVAAIEITFSTTRRRRRRRPQALHARRLLPDRIRAAAPAAPGTPATARPAATVPPTWRRCSRARARCCDALPRDGAGGGATGGAPPGPAAGDRRRASCVVRPDGSRWVPADDQAAPRACSAP